jgi:steroid delta-isomerase-like uncharacterized protein
MGKFEDQSKKLAKAISAHDLEATAKLYAANAVAYDPMYPEPLRGREAISKDNTVLFRAFPDVRFEIVSVIEKDDRSGAAEIRLIGTNTGPLATPTGQEIPPTNKRVEIKGAAFAKLNESGEIIEERRYYDVATFMRELGLMPEQAEEPTAAKR